MHNKPKKWIATILGLFAQPLGPLYAGSLRWSVIFLALGLAIGILDIVYLHRMVLTEELITIAYAIISGLVSYRLAKHFPDERTRPKFSRWSGLVSFVFILVIITFSVHSFFIETFRFPSASMLPTIEPDSYFAVKKWGYGNYGWVGVKFYHTTISSELNRGDILVFEYPKNRSISYAKRLIGLPGDKITYQDKRLFVNDREVAIRQSQDYYNSKNQSYMTQVVEKLSSTEYSVIMDKDTKDSRGFTCLVPSGQYFTLGDNRDNSNDSRFWGFVPVDHVIGKVIKVFP